MATNFTDQQRKAIDSRCSRLIVSAAAGSGKTAVLVERVIGIICDEEHPRDIDSLVVVTFTNAAATEMRGKIASVLLDRLAQNPESLRLKRQLALLSSAKIQTVHAFCLDLIRQNFTKCNIAADFALSDEVECSILMQSALEELLEERYEQNSTSFVELCTAINEERGDRRLYETIIEIYEKLRSHPNPEKWLDMVGKGVTMQNGDAPLKTGWGSFLHARANAAMDYAIKKIRYTYEQIEQDCEVFGAYHKAFEYCLDTAGRWEAAKGDWDSLFNVIKSFENPRLSALRKGDKELAKAASNCKKQFADTIDMVKAKYICASGKQIKNEMRLSIGISTELCSLVSDFSKRFDEKKRERNILDFADLEHMALRLLVDKDGEQTLIAKTLSESVSEILVDEYQDTNEIQDAIFTAIKPQSGGLFMVGDVKQSIYRFRLANPDIFVDKYMSYEGFDDGVSENKRLSLNKNFRSDRGVLDLCNYIFSRIMSRELGEIDYTEEEQLFQGASFEGSTPCEFYVVDMQDSKNDEESPKAAQAEAMLVASRIAQLLKSMEIVDKQSQKLRPAKPSDFVILLSSFRNKAPIYANELSRMAIPVAASGGESMLDTMEIQVLLSYLRIIDNRRQDVPLISVMRSPLYLFTPDELGEIRLYDIKNGMFDALVAAAEHMPKARDFLQDLNYFVNAAQDCDTGQLLQLVLSRTGATGVFAALDSGDDRRQNLGKLLNMARTFDGSKAKGLYSFLQYIDKMIDDGRDVSSPPQKSEAVQIMSIHKSKGLEFPVVFVPDLAKKFNTDELKKPVLFHQYMGIGTKIRDSKQQLEFKTQLYQAVLARTRRELVSEEMRKLYVAMTRAKQKLIMSVTLSDAAKKLNQWAESIGENGVPVELLAEQSSAAMWVCTALLTHPSAKKLRALVDCHISVEGEAGDNALVVELLHYSSLESSDSEVGIAEHLTPQHAEQYLPWLDKIEREYSHQNVVDLPSKLTPTGAKRLLPESAEIELKQKKAVVRLYSDPGKAARRGTAMHKFLELADFKVCMEQGCQNEIIRLVNQQRINQEQSLLISKENLDRFFQSQLSQRIVKADSFTREYEFSALFSPSEVLENNIIDEEILMNGTIDLLLFEGDALSIIDFKTDRIQPENAQLQAEGYRLQLDVYAKAATKIFQKPVKDRVIFFLHTGQTIILNREV